MTRKRTYHNKQPLSTLHPAPCHWTRKGNSWKAKVKYESEEEAAEYLMSRPGLIGLGYVAYQCLVCYKWHVGKEHIANR